METLKEFYIYGIPIDTKIGKLHFMTVREYYDFIKEGYLNSLVLTKDDLLNKFIMLEKLDENLKVLTEILSEMNLFEFLKFIEGFSTIDENQKQQSYIHVLGLFDLYLNFRKMFEFCFKEDVFSKISNCEEFEEYRDLIIEINCIPYKKPNPNPEIEKYNQMKRLIQKHKGESINFESMYTSVGLVFGKDPDDMTLYKFNKYFSRLAQFKNYDTTTLFATVSSDVKIESWYKVIEENKEELQTISEEEFRRRTHKSEKL